MRPWRSGSLVDILQSSAIVSGALALSTVGLLAVSVAAPATASTWPGLRGPSYDGTVRDARLFAGDQGELKVVWKTELGPGYSVVAADSERLVTAFQQGNGDFVAAFDPGSGDELWRHRIADAHKGHTGSHDGPIATPVLDGGRVYGLGPRGDLYALDAATGEVLWAKSLVDDLGAEPPYYGFASSPVVADGVLVVAAGAGEGRAILGLDAATGEERWAAGTDRIRYQSPVLTRIGGRLQVVAAGNQTLQGLDPATGAVLWRHEHFGDLRDMGGNTIVPLPAGEGRILLLNRHPTSVMLKVTPKEAGDEGGSAYEVSELWTASTIKSTYVVPVYHDGHIYGMNSKILTCIDAETGEMKWRSREPGDGFPTLVGDHLVIMTKPGVLRVARASSEGYRQVAELALFDELSWTAPTFADGHLFVRSMGHLARVDPSLTDGSGRREASSIDATRLGRFLDRVEAADAADRAGLIDAFLAEQESFPIVEDSGAVHFLYRGEAQDVGIVGDMIGLRREDPMHRVADTDLFYYSMRLEPDAAVTYGFIPDYGDPVADPLNPRQAEGLFGELSWLAMPAWSPPTYLDGEVARPGTLETVEWESEIQEGRTRKASVYLPAGYGDAEVSEKRYPVVYVFGGDDALEKGRLKDALDHLTGDRVRPVLAVFVLSDPQKPDRGPQGSQRLTRMVVEELVSLVDGKYRTAAEPMARAVVGAGGAADVALATAFAHPDVFARVGGLWPIVFAPMGEIPRADESPLVIYHAWGTYHLRTPHEAANQVEANRELWASMREAGHRPAGGEEPEGFGWVIWRAHTAEMLATLFPRRAP